MKQSSSQKIRRKPAIHEKSILEIYDFFSDPQRFEKCISCLFSPLLLLYYTLYMTYPHLFPKSPDWCPPSPTILWTKTMCNNSWEKQRIRNLYMTQFDMTIWKTPSLNDPQARSMQRNAKTQEAKLQTQHDNSITTIDPKSKRSTYRRQLRDPRISSLHVSWQRRM